MTTKLMGDVKISEHVMSHIIIQEIDNDTAVIMMVNANLPQDKVLPSEMAWALRMKMEALCHRGREVDGIDPGTLSVEVLMQQPGKSKNQIYRYVHLTELVPDLMDMVDADKIGFSIAADQLYQLSRKEQAWILDCIGKYEATPSASQAMRLKKHSKDETLMRKSFTPGNRLSHRHGGFLLPKNGLSIRFLS